MTELSQLYPHDKKYNPDVCLSCPIETRQNS